MMVRVLHPSEVPGTEPQIDWGNIPDFVSPVLEARSGSTFVDTVSLILRRIGFETCVYSNVHAGEHSCLLVASHYTHR